MGSKNYNPDIAIRYNRKNLRLKTHNYGWSGSYFVTIRTKDYEPLFEIPELFAIVSETWKSLPQRFSSVTLDEFIIMPDHVHFIIHIEGNVEKPASLGDTVGAFKSLATVAWLRHIKTTGMERSGIIWQKKLL